MSRATIISCDICGDPGALACYFYTDRKLDAAGSMDDELEGLDLCSKHQWAAYKLAEQFLNFEETQAVVFALKNKQTKVGPVK